MENFDPKPNAVKEKNLYILHLDTPRIVIIASVIIGIIAAAFLFGMSFIKDDKPAAKELAISGMNFDDKKPSDIIDSNIPPVPGDGAEENSLDDKITTADDLKNSTAIRDNVKPLNGNELADTRKGADPRKDDVLTNENIKEIIPPVEKHKSPAKSERVAKKDKKSINDNSKKIAKKENKKIEDRHAKADGKSKIYEVSRDVNEKRGSGSYSVQVASYDTMSKAEHEKSVLKNKRFDAYIDKGLVNGKNYYRVRIGPVSSSKKAIDLLHEVQGDQRYSGSYMVKD